MEKITISHKPAKLLGVPSFSPGTPGLTDNQPRVVKPFCDIFATKLEGGITNGTDQSRGSL